MRSVLVICERFWPEQFLVNDIVSDWAQMGLEVTVLTQVPSYPEGRVPSGYRNRLFRIEHLGPVRVLRFFTVTGYRRNIVLKALNYLSFAMCACIVSVLLAHRLDSVFIYHTGPLTQALPVLFLKSVFHMTTSIWTQDIWPDTLYAFGLPAKGPVAWSLERFVREIYRRFDFVYVSSPGFSEIVRRYTRETTHVEFVPQWPPDSGDHNGVGTAEYAPGRTHFAFTGNVGVMQNLAKVIRAFHLAESAGSRSLLTIVGDGSDLERLKSLCASERVGNVRFVGWIERGEVAAWLEGCDFTVFSLVPHSVIELTIPAKFQAYLVSGKPMLVAARGEVARLARTYGIGETCDPDDAEDIARAILRLESIDSDRRRAMSIAMRELVRTDYVRSNSVRRLARGVLPAPATGIGLE